MRLCTTRTCFLNLTVQGLSVLKLFCTWWSRKKGWLNNHSFALNMKKINRSKNSNRSKVRREGLRNSWKQNSSCKKYANPNTVHTKTFLMETSKTNFVCSLHEKSKYLHQKWKVGRLLLAVCAHVTYHKQWYIIFALQLELSQGWYVFSCSITP